MSLLFNLIEKYKTTDETELEYIFKNINSFLYKKIFDFLYKKENSFINEESINIIYSENNKSNRITKFYKNGVVLNDLTNYMIKYKINKSYIDSKQSYVINLKKEEIVKPFKLDKINLIRIKLRKSFILKELENWRFDLDIFIEIKDKFNQNTINLYKTKLFNNNDIDFTNNLFNYSLECEYIGDKTLLDENNVLEPNIFVHNIISENYKSKLEYQEYIYIIAKYIKHNKYIINKFKSESGFKRLTNNVTELNRNIYSNIVLPNIEYFYITDKIDGYRAIIYIESQNDLLNIKIISDKLYSINEYKNELKGRKNVFILDSELIIKKNKLENTELSINDIKIFVFDVILYENNNISKLPFEQRINYFDNINILLKKYKLGQIKKFIKLTKNYKNEIKNYYDDALKNDYEIDGLIFTPTSNLNKLNNTVYKNSRNYTINTNYDNTVSYKWKPIDKLTIDFFMIELKKEYYNNIKYLENYNLKNGKVILLFSGISNNDFNNLRINLLDIYDKVIPEKYHKNSYFPIQFSPSDDPYKYIYISNDKIELDNKVGEFKFNIKDNKWELLKIRTDRDIEIERGEYFGNALKYAEYIWYSIKNPLTINDIISNNISKYFLTPSNDIYKPQRIYNSYVKNKLLLTILDKKIYPEIKKDWIVDLAAGKGQDLARFVNMGFKKGLFIDNDSDALYELIERKYNLKLKGNIKMEMEIFTKQLNLKDNYKDNYNKLKLFDIPKKSIDIITCNFAFHYFTDNYNNVINFINFVNEIISKNGILILTCFNGNEVFNLLKTTEYYDLNENNNLKYSIKKLYKSNVLTNVGQKIETLLPFSKNVYYEENLVNYDFIKKEFNKFGFNVESTNSFSIFENEFKHDNKDIYLKLSDNDKKYNKLYHYMIIKKNSDNTIVNSINNDIERQIYK